MFFIALGHSHVVALAKGAYALQARRAQAGGEAFSCRFHYLYDPPYEPAFVEASGGRILNPAILEAVRQTEAQFILTSVGGNEHNVLSIAQRGPRFDFILGEQPDLPLDPKAELIPESAVRETLRDWMKDKTDILGAIRAATQSPIVQIEPPPPLPRAQVLAYPEEFFRSAVDQRRLSSETLRYKMWRVQTRLLREACAQAEAFYVETPPDMIDREGMLAKDACGKDATHANEIYGAAMIPRALQSVSGGWASSGTSAA